MAKIKVLAGDFQDGGGAQNMFSFGKFHLVKHGAAQGWTGLKQTIYNPKRDMISLQQADEQIGIKVFGAAAWGAAGAIIAGPVGLLAGAVLGGRGKKVVFIAEFKDGQKVMGQCSGDTWVKIMAAGL